jgi:hypothetical protein
MKEQQAGFRGAWGWKVLVLVVIGTAAAYTVNQRFAARDDGHGTRKNLAVAPASFAPESRPAGAAGLPLPLVPPRGGPVPGGLNAARGRIMPVVDLNSATLAELETLPGITRDYANKILAARPYRSIEELEHAGIPRSLIEQIVPPAMIRLNGSGPLPAPPARGDFRSAPGSESRPQPGGAVPLAR